MTLFELLNKLDQEGTLGKLYKAGAATLAVYAQREVYSHYLALLSTPTYADRKSKAAHATAEGCGVQLSTVYRAIRSMRREV